MRHSPRTQEPPLSERPFHVQHPVPVRFKDIDVGGHAHHSHALVYFEEARAAWWARVSGRGGLDGVDYILAEAEVRYLDRVLWPQTLSVGVRASVLGKRHFELEYEVRRESTGDVLVTGRTVQIMFDYQAGCSTRIPVAVRAAIDELDGPFGPGGRPAAGEGG